MVVVFCRVTTKKSAEVRSEVKSADTIWCVVTHLSSVRFISPVRRLRRSLRTSSCTPASCKPAEKAWQKNLEITFQPNPPLRCEQSKMPSSSLSPALSLLLGFSLGLKATLRIRHAILCDGRRFARGYESGPCAAARIHRAARPRLAIRCLLPLCIAWQSIEGQRVTLCWGWPPEALAHIRPMAVVVVAFPPIVVVPPPVVAVPPPVVVVPLPVVIVAAPPFAILLTLITPPIVVVAPACTGASSATAEA